MLKQQVFAVASFVASHCSQVDSMCAGNECMCMSACVMSWKRPAATLGHGDAPGTEVLSQGLWKKPCLGLESNGVVQLPNHGNSCPDELLQGPWKKPGLKCNSTADASGPGASAGSWQKPALNITAKTKPQLQLQQGWMQPAPSLDTEAIRDTVRAVHCQQHEIAFDAGMLNLLVQPDALDNCYRVHGKDPARIASALAAGCSCRSGCFKDLKAKAVEEIVALWHGLSEEQQTQYLQGQWVGSTVPQAAEVASHRTKWRLAGKSMCLRGLASLLGTAERTLQKRLKGVLDMRRNHMDSGSLCRQAPKQQVIIDLFFSELYHSVAEDLPEKTCAESAAEVADSMEAAFYWTPEATLAQNVVALQSPEQPQGRLRTLPPGRPVLLFLQFKAWWAANQAMLQRSGSPEAQIGTQMPSWATWWRLWIRKWSCLMSFRKASQHKDCNSCFEMRQLLQKSGVPRAEKAAVALKLQEHLRSQYHDRMIYWALRFSSQRRSGVLSVMIDGFDKGKTVWPHYPWHKCPANLQGLCRPRLILTGALVHGWCTAMFYQDERLHHGASAHLEILFRCLDKVMSMAAEAGCDFPQHLHIQADNTTAAIKNQFVTQAAAYLTGSGRFLTVTCGFLVEGHTHEDLDRLFAYVNEKVIRSKKVETPDDFRSALQQELEPIARHKGEALVVDEIRHVRDYRAWLSDLKIAPSGCYMAHAGAGSRTRPAAHSFVYKCYCDLLPKELDMIQKPRRASLSAAEDVYAILKGRMYMTESQPPVLVLPKSKLEAAQLAPLPDQILTPEPPSKEEQGALSKLAAYLDSQAVGLPRAAAAIRERYLSDGSPVPDDVAPPLLWLQGQPPVLREVIPLTRNMYYEHLPDDSWPMLVKFHR